MEGQEILCPISDTIANFDIFGQLTWSTRLNGESQIAVWVYDERELICKGGVSSPKYRSRFTETLVPTLPVVINACSNMFRTKFESLSWLCPLRLTFLSSGRERFFEASAGDRVNNFLTIGTALRSIVKTNYYGYDY
jgi:hypothetical protein